METSRPACYPCVVVAAPRFVAALAVTLVLVSGILQVGCGVFHCVEAVSGETAAVPPCHGDAGDGGTTSHAPGGGDEACCVTLPLEPSASFASRAAAPAPEVVAAVLTEDPLSRIPRSFVRRTEIGSTAKAGRPSSPTPLRI